MSKTITVDHLHVTCIALHSVCMRPLTSVFDCVHCRIPLISQLFLFSLTIICNEYSVTNIEVSALYLSVVTSCLFVLFFKSMGLGNPGCFMEMGRESLHVTFKVDNHWIMQHFFKHHIHREPWDSAEHEMEWCISCCFIQCCIVRKCQGFYLLRPLLFLSERETVLSPSKT